MIINIRDPMVEQALANVSKELGHLLSEKVDTAFKRKYNCEIVAQDPFGLEGYIYFPDLKHLTLFLLQFGSKT